MKNKSPLYVIAIIASIISLLVANLIVGVLNYNRTVTITEIEDAVHNVIFIE